MPFSIHKLLFLLFTIYFIQNSSAQNKNEENPVSKAYKKNLVYSEFLGNGISWSVNYERIVLQSETGLFGIRIGFSRLQGGFLSESQPEFNFIPLEFVWIKGKKHHFEYGIGITTVLSDEYNTYNGTVINRHVEYNYILVPHLGYRYQKPSGHLLVRAGFSLLMMSGLILPFPGIATGFAF